jgi:hypothetical protein
MYYGSFVRVAAAPSTQNKSFAGQESSLFSEEHRRQRFYFMISRRKKEKFFANYITMLANVLQSSGNAFGS